MANDVNIAIGANTENFQVAIEKAFQTINKFGIKNQDLGSQIDKAYKQLALVAANMSDDVQASFNALNIKSDSAMTAMAQTIRMQSQSAVADFNNISQHVNTTANDIQRAAGKIQQMYASMDASILKDEFKTVGVQSTSSIEEAKLKQINALREITTNVEISERDKVRATEAANLEIARLDAMLVTQAERDNAKKVALVREMLSSKVSAIAQANSAESKMLNDATGMNLKFDYDKERTLAQTRSREMASYAASAMQGEAAAARLSGHVHAGAGFTSQLKAQMEETVPATEKVRNGINGWSLASVAAIAKIQIMYSLINNVMSTIGAMPGKAIDAIENYNTSIVTNAALITSMAGGTKDIGEEYKKNKVYAEAVEKVLVRMDTETSASYEQLQIMNRAYMQQGVYLDINNKKAIEGRRNTANALAVIAQATPNPNMQFGQEIRGLMNGTMKEGNALLKMLVGIDKDVVEKIERWKKAGTLDENIGKLLQGFAAAQGDIDNMWATVKSTMATIRDEILRGGLAPAFGEIVGLMKEINKWAGDNKEKIQAFLKEGFADAKAVAKFIWEWRDGFVALGKAAIFLAVTSGIASVIEKLKLMDATFKAGAFYKALSNPLIAGAVVAYYGGYKAVTQVNENERMSADAARANQMASGLSAFGNQGPQFNAHTMGQFQNAFPNDGPELLALAKSKGLVELIADNLAGGSAIYKLKMDVEAIKKLRDGLGDIAIPKPGKGGKEGKTGVTFAADNYNAFENEHYKLLLKNIDEYNKKLNEQQKDFYELSIEIDRTTDAEKRLFNLQNMQTGDLKTDKYKTTSLYDKHALTVDKRFAEQQGTTGYRLNTNEQYSIPMSRKAFDPYEESIKLSEAYNDVVEAQLLMERFSPWQGLKAGLVDYSRYVDRLGEQFTNLAIDNIKRMEDALTNFVIKGKLDFKSLADAIIADMVRIAIQQMVTGPLASGLGAMMQPSSTLTNTNNSAIATPSSGGVIVVGKATAKAGASTPGANLSGTSTANASAGNTTFILQNNTGTQMKQRDGGSSFDGKQMVKTIILEALDTDYTFRNAVRG